MEQNARDLIILVDENDNEIGYGEKMKVHQDSLLHRAFSIFVFDWNKHEMLLQKRAVGKYHSGGLWTNACCSHPRKGETMTEALCCRLKEELGFSIDLKIVEPHVIKPLIPNQNEIYSAGSFQYFAKFDGLSENEIDHVFVYFSGTAEAETPDFNYNPTEISELKWIKLDQLEKWLNQSPEDFTAWFRPAYELARKILCRQAEPL